MTLEELRDIKMKEMMSGSKPKKVSRFQVEAFRFFLWCKRSIYNSFVFLYNHTFGLVSFRMRYSEIQIPINHVSLIETLLQVHGHQIIMDGFPKF